MALFEAGYAVVVDILIVLEPVVDRRRDTKVT
jgi:hypothetical protein